MARGHELVYALNAGGVDKEALSRVDLEKMRLAGEHPVNNWLPKVVGPMTLRPGLKYIADIPNNAETRIIAFRRTLDTKYPLLMSANEMRPVSGDGVVQVQAVATAINDAGWTDASDPPATAVGGASLSLSATITQPARLRQALTIAPADQNTPHTLTIVVGRGPVYLRIGTAAGEQGIQRETGLDVGTHKISFTPDGAAASIDIISYDQVLRAIDSIAIEPSGDLVIPTPWSFDQVKKLRTWQSIDTIFAGDGEQQQHKIEHRGENSWSVTKLENYNGPYVTPPGLSSITMTPGARIGNTTMTASAPYFEAADVGGLIELTQSGKTVSQTLNAQDQATDYITVTGITAGRIFQRTAVEAAFMGTLTLQRSFETSNPVTWSDFQTFVDGAANFTNVNVDDDRDNIIAHYRFAIKAGEYTSGSVDVTLEYENQTSIGQAIITGFTSDTLVDIEVRSPFGATTASRTWRVGAWSDGAGWPRVPIIHDGRMHWFDGSGQDFGSVVDDFQNFDDLQEGDSAPFTRSISGGQLEGVVWAQSDDRLIAGTPGFEATIQANEFDGALTPTNYTTRRPSRRGCADLESVSHHAGIFYVGRSGHRLYEMSIQSGTTRYRSNNISRLNPGACDPGVVRLAMQLQPETRLYAVLEDGSMAIVTHEPDDDVIAFTTVTTPVGNVEDIAVLPDRIDDSVDVIINNNGQRSLQRFARESEQGSTDTCALLDGHEVLAGPVSTIAAPRFAGQTIQAWADGERRGDVVVDGAGNGVLDGTYNRVVYGVGYEADFKSAKLAHMAQLGTAVSQEKILRHMGLVLSNSCLNGLTVGTTSGNLVKAPATIEGEAWMPYQHHGHKDIAPFPVSSSFKVDERFMIKAESAEGPVTVQAVVIDLETPENYTPNGQ